MEWFDDADRYSDDFAECFSNRYSESSAVFGVPGASASCSYVDKFDDGLCSDSAASQFGSGSVLHNFTAMQYGFLPKPSYRHPSGNGDITCVTYNSRLQQFVIIDSSGVTMYNPKAQETRAFPFPFYQRHIIRHIIHVDSYNVYFVITNNRGVKVLNKDFEVACSLEDNLPVLDLVYNVAKQELVTCGVDGVKFWSYRCSQDNKDKKSTTMSHFVLQLRRAITPPVIGDHWVHKLHIDTMCRDSSTQRLCCIAGEDLLFYNMEGDLLAMWQGLHDLPILSYVRIPILKFSVTSGKDCCVKVWTEIGGLVHKFTAHTKPVIQVVSHPDSDILLLSGSSDGMVRVWNLMTMEEAYGTSVCEGELKSVHVLHDRDGWMLCATTRRAVNLFSLNHLLDFWCWIRCRVCSLHLVVSQSKGSRVTAIGEDNSIRILSEKTGEVISTLLPPPSSLLTAVKAAVYSRLHNLVFTLISERELWVYTTRTNPSCRIDVWDGRMLDKLTANRGKPSDEKLSTVVITSLCILLSPVVIMTDEGEACPDCHEFLVLGLQNGSLLFLDSHVRGLRHALVQVDNGSVLNVYHDVGNNTLLAMCQAVSHFAFQFWSLPELQLQQVATCAPSVTCFAHMRGFLLCGHDDGAIHVHCPPLSHGGSTAYLNDSSILSAVNDEYNHVGPVCSADCHDLLSLFLSTGTDGCLKIWDTHQTLLREIDLGPSLGAAIFLNGYGDILLSFQHQLYCMKSTKFYPLSAAFWKQTNRAVTASDSAVFEDPSLKYDIGSAQSTTNMESYLVPYSLPLKKAWLLDDGLEYSCKSASEENNDSDVSDVFSMASSQPAPSEVYQSPESTLPSPLGSLTDVHDVNMIEYKYNSTVGGKNTTWPYDWPLVGFSPVASPPQSPTQFQSIVEISATVGEQENSVLNYMKEKLPIVSPLPVHVQGQSQLKEFHPTVSQKTQVMNNDCTSSSTGRTVSTGLLTSSNCSNPRPQPFGTMKLNSASVEISSYPPMNPQPVIHQYTSTVAKTADTVSTTQKDTGSTRSLKKQMKQGRKAKMSQNKHQLSQIRQQDNRVVDVATVDLPSALSSQTEKDLQQFSKEQIEASDTMPKADSVVTTMGTSSSITPLQQAGSQIPLYLHTTQLHAQEPLNAWDDVSEDVNKGFESKQKLTSGTLHSGTSASDVHEYPVLCSDISTCSDGEQFHPLSVAGSDSCDTNVGNDISSVFSSQDALVWLVPGDSKGTQLFRASILNSQMSACSTVELESGITAIEIRNPEKTAVLSTSYCDVKDFPLPDVTTYDQTWDDRVVARMKVRRERDKERAEGVAIRRQLQEIHRLHNHLFASRHRDCHQNSGGSSRCTVQCLLEEDLLNGGDKRASSAPAYISYTSRCAGKAELISPYSHPQPTPRVRSPMSVLHTAIPPLSNGCIRSVCVNQKQESEFGAHKRSLTGSFRFRHKLVQQKEPVKTNHKSLHQRSPFEQHIHCSIPAKPKFYVLPPGRSSKHSSSPILSPLESKLLQARFESTVQAQRNVKGNKKPSK